MTSVGNFAFENLQSITSAAVPEGVTSLGDYAFDYCRALTEVSLPSTLTSVGDNAFEFCDRLAAVSLPRSVRAIEANAFSRCTALTGINYAGTETSWSRIVISDGNEQLATAAVVCAGQAPQIIDTGWCGQNISWTPDDEGTMVISGSGTMNDYSHDVTVSRLLANRDLLISVVIEEGVKNIGACSFLYCDSLLSISIPSTVTNIKDSGVGVYIHAEIVTDSDKLIYEFVYTEALMTSWANGIDSTGCGTYVLKAKADDSISSITVMPYVKSDYSNMAVCGETKTTSAA